MCIMLKLCSKCLILGAHDIAYTSLKVSNFIVSLSQVLVHDEEPQLLQLFKLIVHSEICLEVWI